MIPAILILGWSLPAGAQPGGTKDYDFLNLVTSARIAAVGGRYTTVNGDDDLSLALVNPSLLQENMHRKITLDYINYFADINYGGVGYAHHFAKTGTLAASMKYINYGAFTETNPQGDKTGSFKASDYVFQLGATRPLDSLFVAGINLKFLHSALAEYTSSALAADLALTYRREGGSFAATAMLRNFGAGLKPYVPGVKAAMPFEIEIGLSKKLEHLPFRYILQLTDLQQWDLTYENTNDPVLLTDPLTGEAIEPKKKVGDKIMRHVVIGGELSPSDNFHLRFGYNYRRRQELKVPTRSATVGFSWGFGFRVSRFHLSYGRAVYHLAGPSNHFSITTAISDFVQKASPGE